MSYQERIATPSLDPHALMVIERTRAESKRLMDEAAERLGARRSIYVEQLVAEDAS